jgi:uncharacterized UPF0160 family protein
MIRGLPKNTIDASIMLPCPESWRGRNKEELCEITGVEGCLFAHASGYLVGVDTFDHCLKVAHKWVGE